MLDHVIVATRLRIPHPLSAGLPRVTGTNNVTPDDGRT
jgi:hypothetical protein